MITYIGEHFISVQSLSHIQLFATPWTAAHQASMSITNSWSSHKLMSFESVMPSNHLVLCHPLLLLPSIFPNIRVFSNESAFPIRWPKYWSGLPFPSPGDLPDPVIKPGSSELQADSSPSEPPGKPRFILWVPLKGIRIIYDSVVSCELIFLSSLGSLVCTDNPGKALISAQIS